MRLIDANKLINIVNEMPIVSTEPGWFKAAVLLAIVGAPTIELAPVVYGRWTKKNDQGVFYCSECDLPSLRWWPYCERCGAKMETEISDITETKFAPSLDDASKEFNAKWTISGAKMDGGEG